MPALHHISVIDLAGGALPYVKIACMEMYKHASLSENTGGLHRGALSQTIKALVLR
ncbi:MAG: hypothetical protein HUU08_15740 [Candidatus Brocadia sp.]|nr:hypothetical protein [Candidatus Brocadia sp.]